MQTEMRPERMADVTALWADIASSRLPLLHKSDGSFMPGLSPVTEYIDYAGVLAGEPCTMRIRTVGPEFYAELKEKVVSNELRLYEDAADSIGGCTEAAWRQVQEAE